MTKKLLLLLLLLLLVVRYFLKKKPRKAKTFKINLEISCLIFYLIYFQLILDP